MCEKQKESVWKGCNGRIFVKCKMVYLVIFEPRWWELKYTLQIKNRNKCIALYFYEQRYCYRWIERVSPKMYSLFHRILYLKLLLCMQIVSIFFVTLKKDGTQHYFKWNLSTYNEKIHCIFALNIASNLFHTSAHKNQAVLYSCILIYIQP